MAEKDDHIKETASNQTSWLAAQAYGTHRRNARNDTMKRYNLEPRRVIPRHDPIYEAKKRAAASIIVTMT